MSVKIEGGDLPGLKSLIERMNKANRGVLVGVPASAEEQDGATMAKIAVTHEFGDPDRNIPERSFLRSGVRESVKKFSATNRDSLRKVVRGELTVAKAVDRLGVVAAGEVKRKIGTGPFEPIKPATIEARKRKFGKKSTKPLIASGNLRQSITHIVEGQQSAGAKVIE